MRALGRFCAVFLPATVRTATDSRLLTRLPAEMVQSAHLLSPAPSAPQTMSVPTHPAQALCREPPNDDTDSSAWLCSLAEHGEPMSADEAAAVIDGVRTATLHTDYVSVASNHCTTLR